MICCRIMKSQYPDPLRFHLRKRAVSTTRVRYTDPDFPSTWLLMRVHIFAHGTFDDCNGENGKAADAYTKHNDEDEEMKAE